MLAAAATVVLASPTPVDIDASISNAAVQLRPQIPAFASFIPPSFFPPTTELSTPSLVVPSARSDADHPRARYADVLMHDAVGWIERGGSLV